MILEETYTLSNGVAIPKLGLGTWFINNEAVVQAVEDAAKLGYRHIDTAQAYGNENVNSLYMLVNKIQSIAHLSNNIFKEV